MNRTSDYEFTIIVPVYNEEDNMPAIERKLGGFLPKSLKKACVLMIDDGSCDGSLACMRDICSRNRDFFYLQFEKNCGLSAAMKAGIDAAESEWVGYIDADLQTDPEDFNLLLAKAGEFDMVTGIRANRKDSGFKKLQSRIANGFRRRMTGDVMKDTGCPLKVIRTSMAKKVPFFTGMHRFLGALLMLQNARIEQIPVRHYPRVAGVSKFSLGNRLAGPFMDCFAYRWIKKRYIDYHVASDSISENAETISEGRS